METILKIKYILGKKFFNFLRLLPFSISLSFLEVFCLAILTYYITLITNQSLEDFENSFNFSKKITSDKILFSQILIFIFFVKFIYQTVVTYLISKFTFSEKRNIQSQLVKGYMNLDYKDFKKKTLDEINETVQKRVGHYINSINILFKFVGDFFMTILILIFLLNLNFIAFIVMMMLVSTLFIFYNLGLSKNISKYGKEATIASKKIFKTVYEGFKSFKEIKFLKKEKFFFKEFIKAADIEYSNFIKLNFLNSLPRPIFELLIIFVLVIFVMMLPIIGVNEQKLITVLIAFGLSALRLIPSITQLSKSFNAFKFNSFSVDSIYNDIILINKNEKETSSQIKEINNFNEIKFKNIWFKFPDSDNFLFENLSLNVLKGEKILILGKSGSGKSTLLDIISGLLNPTRGEIQIDKKNISEMNNGELRDMIAYVDQDSFYLGQNLDTNIALETTNDLSKKDKETLKRLKKIVNIDFELKRNFENKNFKISGGQRQRVSIARNLYFNKQILIFDESTNSLDSKNEMDIINKILEFEKDKTIIFVSHNEKLIDCFESVYKFEIRIWSNT